MVGVVNVDVKPMNVSWLFQNKGNGGGEACVGEASQPTEG